MQHQKKALFLKERHLRCVLNIIVNKTNINQVYTQLCFNQQRHVWTIKAIFRLNIKSCKKCIFCNAMMNVMGEIWWLITNKVVCRLDLCLFYLLAYLKHNGNVLPKNYKCQSSIHQRISKPEQIHRCDVRRDLATNIYGIVIYAFFSYMILRLRWSSG